MVTVMIRKYNAQVFKRSAYLKRSFRLMFCVHHVYKGQRAGGQCVKVWTTSAFRNNKKKIMEQGPERSLKADQRGRPHGLELNLAAADTHTNTA
jgi:hypothetical protein